MRWVRVDNPDPRHVGATRHGTTSRVYHRRVTDTSSTATTRFREWMGTVADLDGAIRLLDWDRETTMPSQGAEQRGLQVKTLHTLRHRELLADDIDDVLAALRDGEVSEDMDAQIAHAERQRRRAIRLTEDLVREVSDATNNAVTVWLTTREDGDFATFAPALRRVVEAARATGDAIGLGAEPYDGLLDEYEPGMTAATLEDMFAALTPELSAIVAGVDERPPATPFGGRSFDAALQVALAEDVAATVGFNRTSGLIARSAHPFTTSPHAGDVRFTTRIADDDPMMNVLVTMHEVGHGLYSQGHPAEHARTFLFESPSLGAEESQARFFENHLGRHPAFLTVVHRMLLERFGSRMDGITPDDLARNVHHIQRGWCRVDADEVTYDLHIALRLRLELALVRGDLAVDDLPGAWREESERLLGVTPADDARGCMQDIHWAWGLFGYFPTYTLGNMYAAQLALAFAEHTGGRGVDVVTDDPTAPLRFLRDRIHRHGNRYETRVLMENATGRPFSPQPLVERLRGLAAAQS